jgi:rhodanese-related sulfurtransferase
MSRKHKTPVRNAVASAGASPPRPESAAQTNIQLEAGLGVFSRSVLRQVLAIVGLSSVLGLAFNAASPVGVRLSEAPPAATGAMRIAKTNPPAIPTSPMPAPALPSPVVPSAPQPAKVALAAPAPAPVSQPNVPPKPWSVSPSPTSTNPVVVAAPPAVPNPAPIHWPEAKALVAAGNGVLVDVRHKAMYDAGHIPGAFSLPEMSPPEGFKTFLEGQSTNTTLIVYCSSTSCSQSARVATRLVNEFRWPAVRFMTGGYLEYQQAELNPPAAPLPAAAPHP